MAGFHGARVRDIAARADVSKDLVSYYFGGKEGLYRAVQRRWLAGNRPGDENRTLAGAVAEQVRQALADDRAMRLLVWRGLAARDEAPPDEADPDAPPRADSMRRRQSLGEIDADIDPAALQLALLGMVSAPIVFPDAARRLFGVDTDEPEFEERYRAALDRILAGLAPRDL